jgi:hypothetical protein
MLPSQAKMAERGKIVSRYRQDGLCLSILRILMHLVFQGLIAVVHLVDILPLQSQLLSFWLVLGCPNTHSGSIIIMMLFV